MSETSSLYPETQSVLAVSHDSHQWYDTAFENAQLDTGDARWLTRLRDRPVDDEWLRKTNKIIAVGSINLVSNTDPETLSSVMKARDAFYAEQLGWGDKSHPFHQIYERIREFNFRTIPTATFIQAQRTYSAFGIDGGRVLKSDPASISISKTKIEGNMAVMAEVGITDVARAANAFPAILAYSADSIRAKVQNLAALGFDAPAVVNRLPGVLSVPPKALRLKTQLMAKQGIDVKRAIKHKPGLLFLSAETFTQRLEALKERSLDLKRINAYPHLLDIPTAAITAKMKVLDSYEIDAEKAIQVHPMILGLATNTIRQKIDILNQLGFNAAELINRQPVLLGFSSETLMRKMGLIDRYLARLHWEGGTAHTLVERSPTILKISEAKLLMHAHIFARFGRSDMPASEVATLLLKPAASHMLALDRAEPYGTTPVNKQRLVGAEREAEVAVLLENPAFRSKVGRSIIRSYDAYSKK